MDLFNIYSQNNRRRSVAAALALTAAIALIDWRITPYIAIGFLYFFPIILISGFVRPPSIIVFSLICAWLQEQFSNLPPSERFTRLALSLAGFAGTGLFIHGMVRNRRMTLEHLAEVEGQMQLRRDAEEQLRVLVDTSPAAIVTLDGNGNIVVANESARRMFAPYKNDFAGQSVAQYLPTLYNLALSTRSQSLQTAIQCRGYRLDGEVFLAGIWFSTYSTSTGRKLAAIMVDISEDLRDREDLSLDYLLKNAHILMSAITHEVRNVSATMEVFCRNLQETGTLTGNQDFEALASLIDGLSKLSAMELLPLSQSREIPSVELGSVLDELHILIGSIFHDSEIELDWRIHDELPLVAADRYGLLQVFLNLVKNSRRAMEDSARKQFTVKSMVLDDVVEIRLKDSGPGIPDPQSLFRPFQRRAESAGLGLYVSRAIVRSFGGDLVHEPTEEGCCFVLILPRIKSVSE